MEFTRTSMFSGIKRTRNLPVTEEQVLKYANGALIQDAFPNLSASDRKFIMTGVTDEEWDAAFADSED